MSGPAKTHYCMRGFQVTKNGYTILVANDSTVFGFVGTVYNLYLINHKHI